MARERELPRVLHDFLELLPRVKNDGPNREGFEMNQGIPARAVPG